MRGCMRLSRLLPTRREITESAPHALSFLFVGCAMALPQRAEAQDTLPLEEWAEKLETFGKSIPQEEVFVHMDNTCYYLGDTIYYKAYMRLSDGRPSTLSHMLYVELLNQDGYLVERQKLEMTRGQGYGSFVLPDTLYGGYYELRAYTRWQLNWGEFQHPHTKYAESWFYSKKMAQAYYRDYDKLYSRVFPVYNHPQKPGDYDQVMTTRPLRRYFKSKDTKPQASITFYPEGGNLVSGTRCRVAFEANDADDGRHLKGMLTVKDKSGSKVAECQTQNRGRGSFELDCKAGEEYVATFAWDGNSQTEKLPTSQSDGCAMTASAGEEGIHVELQPRGKAAVEPLGLTVSCHGILKSFKALGQGETLSADIEADELETGVAQLTVFNAEGRIYADRLIFMDKEDIDLQAITFSGIKGNGYAPYEAIGISVKGAENATISLAVRDGRNSTYTFDTGNILTEMLLSSQIKGFVEQPEYFFEARDEQRRTDLDLLLMVQGWRRYNWVEMTHQGAFSVNHPYERTEILLGEVNLYTPEEEENQFTEASREMMKEAGMDVDAEAREAEEQVVASQQVSGFSEAGETVGDTSEESNERFEADDSHQGTTTKTDGNVSTERFYNNEGNLKREVMVHAEFVQPGVKTNGMAEGEVETYNKGLFRIDAPKLYEACFFFFAASDTTKWKAGKEHVWTSSNEDKNGRVEYPEFYVKLDPIFPRFVKPYSFYQVNLPESRQVNGRNVTVDNAVILDEVTIGAKRNGTRRFDSSKPAFVLDAYQAFNDVCDAGLCPGYFIGGSRFSYDVARNYIGDMNMARSYDLERRYNTKNTSSFISAGVMEKYNHLTNLDKVYVYTDYSPRNEGDEKFSQDNQPTVTVDLRIYEDNSQRMAWRDRRMLLTGFAVCEDFYQPDYTDKPVGEPTDYRRTLYWNPNLQLDGNGEAEVHFFNNASQTQLCVSAEGMTASGQPLTGIRYPEDF